MQIKFYVIALLLVIIPCECYSDGVRTKVYADSIVRIFNESCSDWGNEQKRCRFTSENGLSHIDSIIYRNPKYKGLVKGDKDGRSGDSGEYYDLFERIYDDEGFLIYVSMYIHGFSYNRMIYNRGRLVYVETGCDTLQSFFKDDCRMKALAKKASVDSNGRYVFSREKYEWNSFGRLKKRVLWYSNDVLKLNSSYIYTYGTPCDTIHVTPVDYPINFYEKTGVYDGSFGKIPEIEDPEYKDFAENPYEFDAPPELLERQKKRCEDYKKSLKKGNGKTR